MYHFRVLLNCLKEFNNKTDILTQKLRPLADGKTRISLYKEINRLTLDIISSVLQQNIYFIDITQNIMIFVII